MVPVRWRAPGARREPRFPFRLNTGRIRDQWHTMTRSGLSPRLSAHMAEPFVEIHPEDAARLCILPDHLVELQSPSGRAILRATITDRVIPGTLFAPMHWTGETGPTGRVGALVASASDPVSGQPESKAAVVAARPFDAAWCGFAVSRERMRPEAEYWAVAPSDAGWRMELAGRAVPPDWEAAARSLFGLPEAEAQILTDARRSVARVAFRAGGRLIAALFAGPAPLSLARDYLATLPGTTAPDVLSGRPPADRPDPGPVLCSCFGVGANTILTAIEREGLSSLDAIGAALSAGANCGSCRPEIAALLARATRKEAAE